MLGIQLVMARWQAQLPSKLSQVQYRLCVTGACRTSPKATVYTRAGFRMTNMDHESHQVLETTRAMSAVYLIVSMEYGEVAHN